nr:uncharacterized protein LOC113819685 [Penaeus vannamei]
MGPPRAPPRDLDRLRALSPLSQRCRRSPTMNPRTPLMLTPRGGSSSVGGSSTTPVSRLQATTPQASKAQGPRSIRAPSTPVNSNKQGRSLRVTNTRPTRPTTAVIASPRKASAPSKLISVLGGSLDNLPSTVSVRRKTSAPAKTLSGNSSTNNYGKKSSVTISARTRKTSSSSSTSSGSPTARW